MVTVLITGRMGSGKSQILDFIKSKGYNVFEADHFVRDLLESQSPCFKTLVDLLGPSFLAKGSFDRRILAQELFQNTDKLKEVEKVIHPLVQEGFKNFVEEQKKKGKEVVFYEMPLLSREAIQDRFDYVILARCPKKLSLKRLKKKGFKEREIYLRWNNQAEEERVLDLVDFIILNNGDLKFLKQQMEKVLLILKKGSEK